VLVCAVVALGVFLALALTPLLVAIVPLGIWLNSAMRGAFYRRYGYLMKTRVR